MLCIKSFVSQKRLCKSQILLPGVILIQRELYFCRKKNHANPAVDHRSWLSTCQPLIINNIEKIYIFDQQSYVKITYDIIIIIHVVKSLYY